MKRSWIRSKRAGPPRKGRVYDRAYMDWISRQVCCVPNCGAWPCDPAHTKVLGRRGMGQKTSDRSCIPLCRDHHYEQEHGMRTKTFEQDYGICIFDVVVRLNKEYDGLVISTEAA